MWPWGHLAVGYLSYTAGVRLVRASQERAAILALAVGTQFPDLVDKPLTWVGVLAYGRSLAHSLLVLVPLCLVVVVVARRRGTHAHTAWAFALGALSHTFADAWDGIAAYDADRLSFLLWPLLPGPDGDVVGTPAGHAAHLASEVETTRAGASGLVEVIQSDPVVQGFLLAVAVAVWVAEGTPGRRE